MRLPVRHKAFRIISTVFLAVFFSLGLRGFASAESLPSFTYDGVEWVYKEGIIRTAEETGNLEYCQKTRPIDTPALIIGFKSAPNDATEVKLPSFAEVVNAIGDQSLLDYDTYYIDALVDAADASIPAGVTKIDATDSAKVQIRNLSPLLDENTNEIELDFGADVVIADNMSVSVSACDEYQLASYTYEKGAFEGLKLDINGLENVKYIGWRAFKGTTLTETSVTISGSQTIGGRIFEGSNLTSATINTAEVGEGFCRDCTELTSVAFSNDVRTIYGHAFRNTPKLVQDFDSKQIEKIGQHAFDTSGLTNVSFNEQIELIDTMAFANTNLGELDFTGVTPRIGLLAFYKAGVTSVNLAALTDINVGAFAGNSITELYLPKSITRVGAGIFAGNPIETVTVAYDPLTLRGYDYDSFNKLDFKFLLAGDSSISYYEGGDVDPVYVTSLTPNAANTVKTLNIVAPYGESDTVPERMSVRTDSRSESIVAAAKNIIPDQYFEDFGPNLETINIGEGFEWIGYQAFAAPLITQGLGSYGSYGVITKKDERGREPSTLSLPSTLRGIGANAFMWALNSPDLVLESLPENLEYIGSQAFLFDTALTIKKFDLPKIKYIGQLAFYGVKVIDITIHDSIERIEHGAFAGDYDLRNITIDTDIFENGVLSDRFLGIFAGSFYTYFGMSGPDAKSGGSYRNYNRSTMYAFHLGTITFTDKSVTAPPSDDSMHRIYADKIDASQTKWDRLGHHAFFAAKIGELLLPSTITEIGIEAFARAEIGSAITLPEGLKKIESRAFWGTKIGNDDSLDVAGGDAPLELDKIKVPVETLPSTLEEIGDWAFYMNKGLTADVELPNLKVLGTEAFAETNIRDLVLPNSLTSLGMNVARDTANLRDVTIDVDLYDSNIATYSTDYMGYYGSFVATFGDQNHKLGTIVFTENAGEPHVSGGPEPCEGFANCDAKWAYFYGLEADKLDLADTNWKATSHSMFQESKIGELVLPEGLETIGEDSFFEAELGDVALPATLKTIKAEGFQWAAANISEFPEGLKTIDDSAFYGADVTDDLVIPASVTFLGKDAFNAGDEDVHYDTITLKPGLSFENTDNQLMFQLFWNTDVDELIIESNDLPALHAGYMQDVTDQPEFHGMPMSKVTITSLPGISANAFEDCTELQEVDMSDDSALDEIGDEAFIRDEKMDSIKFSADLKDEFVTVGKRAFLGTAFETMGDESKDFDLTAAKFDGSRGWAFSGMPKLRSVDVPSSFSSATIPRASFYNDSELTEATIDYKTTVIKNAAFANDDKLERIFIWGDTAIEDKNIGGYTMPTREVDDTVGDEFGPTIPEGTDIYAYSANITEAYAGYEGRDNFEGTFYPLDEVIYLTSNKPRVLLNEDESDFDKSDLIVYGMRRDGLILESDEWTQYDGNVYPRSASSLTFEKMAGIIEENPAFGTIWDTPVPINELNFANVNYEEIDFELIRDPENNNVRLVNIVYTDGYTRGLPDTDIDPYAEGEDSDDAEQPITWDKILIYLGGFAVFVVAGIICAKKIRENL